MILFKVPMDPSQGDTNEERAAVRPRRGFNVSY